MARLAYLQVATHEAALQSEAVQTTRVRSLPARRGDILDRFGKPLATSVECAEVWVHPPNVWNDRVGGRWQPRSPEAVAGSIAGITSSLAPLLDMRPWDIATRLNGTAYRRIGPRVIDPACIEQLVEGKRSRAGRRGPLYRVDLQTGWDRRYPWDSCAANLIGWVDSQGVGASGLERGLEDLLAGADGARRCRVDATGTEVGDGRAPRLDPLHGMDVILSIDAILQQTVEEILVGTLQEQEATSATAVLLDPVSGQIWALASVPSLRRDDTSTRVGEGARIRSVQSMYPPGSTFKPLMMATALDLGLVDPLESLDCSPEMGHFGRRRVSDVHPAREPLTPEEILVHSSNVGMAQILTRLVSEHSPRQVEAMAPVHDVLRQLGLGSRTGVPVPAEAAGMVTPLKRWSRDYTLVSLAFGYEVAVTALQMASAVAALGDGQYRAPRLVLGVAEPGGAVLPLQPSPPRRVFSEHSAALVRSWMASVVDRGSGQPARVEGVRVAGKTGTSVLTTDRDRQVHSFVALAPADDPRMVLVVVITDPQHARYATQSAAPAAGHILRRVLPYLGIGEDPS